MTLDRVTLTGADDSVEPSRLLEISQEYPFVEWGVLLSASQAGVPRFPSLDWLMGLAIVVVNNPRMRLSFHVCGRWVRQICVGNWTPLFSNVGPILDRGRRVQLNFHAYTHLLTPSFLPQALTRCQEQRWQLILRCDGVNDHLVPVVIAGGLDAVPLYDKSGGAGVVPDGWPAAMGDRLYSGYAGGLGPDNLAEELPLIEKAAGGERFWVDMGTKVRSPDDRQFDLTRARRCLEIASDRVGA